MNYEPEDAPEGPLPELEVLDETRAIVDGCSTLCIVEVEEDLECIGFLTLNDF